MSSVVISVTCSAGYPNIISYSDHTCEGRFPSSLTTAEKSSCLPVNSFPTTKTFHVNETRSILVTLSCREIVMARTASARPV